MFLESLNFPLKIPKCNQLAYLSVIIFLVMQTCLGTCPQCISFKTQNRLLTSSSSFLNHHGYPSFPHKGNRCYGDVSFKRYFIETTYMFMNTIL